MKMKVQGRQSGLTLVEIMIAMVLAIIVMGAVITIFVTTVKSSTENIRMVHLNQELRFLVGLMSDELKRAGYSANPGNDVFRNTLNWDAASNCLRYAYDADGDGVLANDENLAFQAWPADAPDRVRWGQGVTSTTCADGVWEDITNPETALIEGFTITSVSATVASVEVDTIEVSITGSVGLIPGTATRTVTESIRVRNDGLMATGS
jgi:Tfp pilus assembly protein PilW